MLGDCVDLGREVDGCIEFVRHVAMDDGIQLLELARNASQMFTRQAPNEKKRLLNLVLSNCEWNRGEVRAVFRQPFDLLAETAASAAAAQARGDVSLTMHPIWLGFLEAFRIFWIPPQP
ncbi:hypothetical protein [Mesorhizobium sp. LNJC391B00]|uniref:hypothetical protein n=1 Tax=Mesorhizobium sp. LNJC391B00 TaxID=1287273 RepID=UPI0003CE692B|nr:hypothetical protein [Mesorhizobium sp. LNJC391B00]ESY18631.1 hypothetical protein X749_30215 [Mesorhizobium sp. LNJC391B00]